MEPKYTQDNSSDTVNKYIENTRVRPFTDLPKDIFTDNLKKEIEQSNRQGIEVEVKMKLNEDENLPYFVIDKILKKATPVEPLKTTKGGWVPRHKRKGNGGGGGKTNAGAPVLNGIVPKGLGLTKCKNWNPTLGSGSCRFGDNCHFSHSGIAKTVEENAPTKSRWFGMFG